jgi:hypothetical protein
MYLLLRIRLVRLLRVHVQILRRYRYERSCNDFMLADPDRRTTLQITFGSGSPTFHTSRNIVDYIQLPDFEIW